MGGIRVQGGALIVVLDTGGVSALAPAHAKSRARLRALRAGVDDLVVPAAVLAEGVLTGHPRRDFFVRRLLEHVAVVPVDEPIGLVAGTLRQAAIRGGIYPTPSGVDAIVVAVADELARRQDVEIVTSDRHDIGMLASIAEHAKRISIIGC